MTYKLCGVELDEDLGQTVAPAVAIVEEVALSVEPLMNRKRCHYLVR